MHPYLLVQHGRQCQVSGHRPPTILFNILSNGHSNNPSSTVATSGNSQDRHPSQRRQKRHHYNCHCHQQHLQTVCLKDPEVICQAACAVLDKTICFMTSLPFFCQLPQRDQLALLHNSWVPLFILGLAQERTEFEVTHSPPASSILKRILLSADDGEGGQGRGGRRGWPGQETSAAAAEMPTLAKVHRLKATMQRLWSLDLSAKEYAYLKGALLFNPDVPGLQVPELIEGLQQEAHRVLQELVVTLHPREEGRLARILLTASSLQTIPHSLISQLFFRPVVGQADLFQLMADMLRPSAVTRDTATKSKSAKRCQRRVGLSASSYITRWRWR